MNLDLIDTFLDLLETGNFNRTAERLETTQSTISGRVKALEQAVGAKLFSAGGPERSRRRPGFDLSSMRGL